MTLWDEVRALRDNYAALEKRIRAIEDEKLATRQIVERSNERTIKKTDNGSGFTLF